jgi:pyruvate kinase
MTTVTSRAHPSASTRLRQLQRVKTAIGQLHRDLLAAEADHAEALAAVPSAQRPSARNLIHYLTLRQTDVRQLQRDLAELGLSSLGRCEAHVLASLEQVMMALAAMAQAKLPLSADRPPVDHRSGPQRLARHAIALFGPEPHRHGARIMVTLARELASDGLQVGRLLDAGMDLARINCAHDDAGVWSAMVRTIRREARRRGRTCRILMDLAGPKLRTGALAPGPQVVTWSPQRDQRGRVLQPARIVLIPKGTAPSADHWDAWLPVEARLIAACRVGDELLFADARSKNRRLSVVAASATAVEARGAATAYVEPGTVFTLKGGKRELRRFTLGALPPLEKPLLLAVGDILMVTAAPTPGHPARRNLRGQVIEPATIPCTLPGILEDVRAGEHIWFDDGKIGGMVREATPARLRVEITLAKPGGTRLRSDKGINLPDSELSVECLTDKDRVDLRFARSHTDLVGLSFIRKAQDIDSLIQALGRQPRRPGIIVKIETPQAFANLAGILMRGLCAGPLGVMVARGDLAVEVGFARMAEVQEEILWLCEAAHLPVIWGTQVLETLAKKGMATRAEVTDAAMSVRAECVMLNKGPHIAEAVSFLNDVLTRMGDHQSKKQTLLRRLSVSHPGTGS